MKITTQQELDDLIATANKTNTIVLDENLEITFNCEIPRNIKANNIKAYNIEAWNIEAWNIEAHNITARNIKAYDIKAWDIKACNIKAENIEAHDITAGDIKAWDIKADNIYAYNIDAHNIEYYAFCIAYQSLKCESISGNRENSFHKCLDQEIEIVKKEEKLTIELTQSQLDKIKHILHIDLINLHYEKNHNIKNYIKHIEEKLTIELTQEQLDKINT